MEDYLSENCDCGFDGDLAGYMYGEIGAAERRSVERHIDECRECAEEIAGLSFARASVRQWNRAEFAQLETPRFVIPVDNNQPLWLSFWRTVRAAGPRSLAAAAVVIAVVFGAVFLWTMPKTEDDRSALDTPTIPETAEVLSPRSTIPPAAPQNDLPAAVDGVEARSEAQERRPGISQSTRRGVSARHSGVRRESVAKETRATPSVGSSVAKRKQPIPSLNSYDEPVDETLRLEDIFSEIDAS